MNDLIERQAAIAYAISGRVRTLPTNEDGENWIRTEEVRQSLLTMPSAQRWISVTERLPENDNDVLVTDGTDCAVAYWRADAQAWDDSMHGWCDLYGLDVVAWMELPKLWEGEQNEQSD